MSLAAEDLREVPKAGEVLFQFGAGGAEVDYPGELNDAMDYLVDTLGYDRMSNALNLNLGVALNDLGYLILGVNGVGDRISDYEGYMQLNHYLYHIGARLYPAVTGVYLQGMFGFSAMVSQMGYSESTVDESVTSDPGSGFGAALGYDFGRAKGFGLALEASVLSVKIEGESIVSGALMLDLRWK
jgi:hypothetical protein